MTSDADLLRQYSEHDSQEAFTELVQRHVDFVYAAAIRQCRCAHRAEDVTQSVFTDLARKASKLCQRSELVGWLFISTRYAAARIARGEARRDRRERIAQMTQEVDSLGDEQVDWGKLKPELDAALGTLPELDRNAILLRIFKGHSFAEVGIALHVSEEAARKRVDRGLEKLRVALARRGVTSTAAALTLAISAQSAVAAPAGLGAHIALVATAQAAAAGAAGGIAGSLFSGIETMVAGKAGVGAAVLAAGLAVGTAFVQLAEWRKAEGAHAQWVQASSGQADRVSGLKLRLEAAERELDALEKDAAASALRASTEGVPTNRRSRLGADQLERERGKAFLKAHPEARELLFERSQAFGRLFFRRLFKEYDFTAEEIEELEKYLPFRGVSRYGLPSGEQIAFTFRDDDPNVQMERQRRLMTMIDREKIRQFDAMSIKESVRTVAHELAAALWSSDTPLTTAQADQLEAIFLMNSPETRGVRYFQSFSSSAWDAALGDAEKILAPAQFHALKAVRDRYITMKQFQDAMAEAFELNP